MENMDRHHNPIYILWLLIYGCHMDLFWTLLHTGRIDLDLAAHQGLGQRRVNSLKWYLISYWVLIQ